MNLSQVPAIVWWAAGFLLLRFLSRPLLAAMFGGPIAARVTANLPDTVHLVSTGPTTAKETVAIEADAMALQREGFSDAGWFTVPEMPGFTLRLLACEQEGWLAMLYEHPKAGRWLELGLRLPDGARASFTSSRPTGLRGLPNLHSVHMAGAPAGAVLAAARKWAARAGQTPLPLSASSAASVFEEGYAVLTAARKAQGISTGEVASVAMRPKFTITVNKDAA